jgi:hypothetical protein
MGGEKIIEHLLYIHFDLNLMLCSKITSIQDRLFYAMLEITCFPITDQSSILVTVKRGWDGEKVYQFLKEHQYKFVRELKWEDRIEKISTVYQ